MVRVEFKSLPEYYEVERKGIKNNTVREIDAKDSRFITLAQKPKDLWIKIINIETNKFFIRKIRDITYYKNLVIITWEHKER